MPHRTTAANRCERGLFVSNDLRNASGRKPSVVDTFRAVAAAFFGVRGRGAHERDVSRLNPVHVILAGIIMAVLFIVTLLVIVRTVVGNA
jgi:hypothetical protein